ncbi:MFS transporter [Deinococcus sp. SL84]|uniref:MFS transporter n=1 Tax=Deinococcus sp. SL84 TaxID=2994663 RepID=UPI0022768EF7|nr:MFS transporter [Deinococcus sp. SL84]MCY1702296.1 MFS transporter [Deinococcus sp. SL84]
MQDSISPYLPPTSFRPFLLLWVGQALSVLGGALSFTVATMWLATVRFPLSADKPALASALTLLSLSYVLSGILAAPIAGIWADHYPRGWLMRAADLTSGVLCSVVALLAFTGALSLPALYLLIALTAMSSSVHGAALSASYVLLVPERHLAWANAMMQSLWTGAGLLAPSLAAALLFRGGRHGLGTAFALDAASFFIAASLLFLVHVPPTPRRATEKPPGLLAEGAAGWQFIRERPALLVTFLTFAALNFAAAPLAPLEPLLVREQLAADLARYGLSVTAGLALIGTVTAVGGLLGAALMTVWGGLNRGRGWLIFGLCAVSSAAQIVYGLSHSLWLTAAMMGLFVFTLPVADTHLGVVLQTQIPPDLQGRVFAVRRMLAQSVAPLSIVLFGHLAGQVPAGQLLASLGLLALVASLLPLLRRDVRRFGDE